MLTTARFLVLDGGEWPRKLTDERDRVGMGQDGNDIGR
jgi:hypothetical protein